MWLEDLLCAANCTKQTATREAPPKPVEVPEARFCDIVFEAAIGSGSFGAVWRARYRGSVVAVKQCKMGAPSEAEMAMLKKEILTLQSLRHDRLVAFLGCCQSREGTLCLLMEFMAGGSLYSFLFGKSQGCPTFNLRLQMALQIAQGLVYLHDCSAIHRDLKTMNVVLDADNNCKICDFGLTVSLMRSHLTVVGNVGTPRYMAPEQLEATSKICEKVDIWQMGCVMLELFCLRIPFQQAQNFQQIIAELLVRRRAPAVPVQEDPRARSLIQACLRLRPAHRPSALMLQQALGGLQ